MGQNTGTSKIFQKVINKLIPVALTADSLGRMGGEWKKVCESAIWRDTLLCIICILAAGERTRKERRRSVCVWGAWLGL